MGIFWKISKWYNRYQFLMWAAGILTAVAAPLVGYASYFSASTTNVQNYYWTVPNTRTT